MADIDLNFIAEQLKRVLSEQTAMRADIHAIRADMVNIADSQTVFSQTMLRMERDLVRIKEAIQTL